MSTTRTERPRVLLVSMFHPELQRGGTQQMCYELFNGLKQRGDVEPFLLAAIDKSYPALFKPGAHITGFDQRDGEFLLLTDSYDSDWHRQTNPAIVQAYIDFLQTIRPAIVHFHHFHFFGIDLVSLTRRILPDSRIVFTFHEFMAICQADGTMRRPFDGSLCRQASQVRCHQCFPAQKPEHFLLRKLWFQHHLAHVDQFTCPSGFMIEHYVAWGLPRARITHVANGQDHDTVSAAPLPSPERAKNRFGFFGQITDAKGVHILLRAVTHLRDMGFTDFSLDINGGNIQFASPSIRAEIEDFLAAEQALPYRERIVTAHGAYHPDDLAARMDRVDWCIVPSIWWESFGLVISEAWVAGRPVICSNAGGPAERINHNINGLHFPLGDHRALAETIIQCCTTPGLWAKLAAQLPTPPTRAAMTSQFVALYA